MCENSEPNQWFFSAECWGQEGWQFKPSLFKIFVNDLPSYLSNTSDPVTVNGKDVHCLMYADDIILLSKSAKVYKKNLIYLIHTVKTGVSLSTQVKLKLLCSIRQADLLNRIAGMEMKILNVCLIVNI